MPGALLIFLDALSHPRRQRLFGDTQIVGHFQVQPEFRRCFEERPKANRRVSGDVSLSFSIVKIRLAGTLIALAIRSALRNRCLTVDNPAGCFARFSISSDKRVA